MSETETKAATPMRETRQPGWDALLEDIFGLNIRALYTMREMLIRPAKVFAAGRSNDWDGKYTPSMRLIFSLLAVMLLLSFFWAGENSFMYQTVDQLLQEAASNKPDLDLTNITDHVLNSYFLFFPIAFAIFHTLAAMMIFIWGKGTKLVPRIRFYYLAMIPSMAFSILSSTLFGVNVVAQTTWFQPVALLIPFLLDWTTLWRCLEGIRTGFGRIWRGLLFAFASQTMTAIASLASFLVARILIRGAAG